MTQGATTVDQARHGVRKERAAHDGSGYDLRGGDDVAGDRIDQILRHTPDGGRLLKEAVRIEIGAAMEAISVIEMTVNHQDAGGGEQIKRSHKGAWG
ncbi:MAG: hypothetical protein AMXMBFR57_19640 [Acidimicrobiia bacterium]